MGQELCGRCEEAFQRVLGAASPAAAPGALLVDTGEADAPTLVTTRAVVEDTTPAAFAPWAPATGVEAFDESPPVEAAPSLAGGGPSGHDAVPEEAPKPWWELSIPVPATAAAVEPVAETPPEPAWVEAPPMVTAAPAADPPAVPAAFDPPSPRPASPVHEPVARPRRAKPGAPPARVARRGPPVGRVAAVALSAGAVCIAALLGAPHAFDLVWSAPAPVSAPFPQPTVTAPADAPLPDTSALVPATDPSETPPAKAAPAAPPAASLAPGQGKAGARATSRADNAAARRAANLLERRAAAQATAAAPQTPAVAVPVQSVPAAEPVPGLVARPEEPAPVAEDLGQAFEVTQVDVRPQVMRQVPPRRPDAGTAADVVVVRVLVSPTGRAADVRVVRGARGAAAYDRAAVDAVRQWTFSPAQRRSRAVSCWVHVGVPFGAE